MKYHIMQVTNFNQNCSLIWCQKTKEAALVDPGGNASHIKKIIKSLKLKVKKILLTHGHLDHVGEAQNLSSFYDIPIYGPHKDEKLILDNLPDQCKMFSVTPIISPFTPDNWLQDKAILTIGKEIMLQVLHCPGHSPGHVIFLNAKSKFILMGDVLFRGNIGRTDLPGGNIDILMTSIRNKILTLHNNTQFLPGHGPISSIGFEKNSNPFLTKLQDI